MNNMKKQNITLVGLLAVGLMVAGSASGDYLYYDGSGNPNTVFTESVGISGSTYNQDAIFAAPGSNPGFLTANGNAGGFLLRDWDLNNDGVIDNGSPATVKSVGWELVWRSRAVNSSQPLSGPVQMFGGGDDVNNWNVYFDADGSLGGGSVFMRSFGTSTSVTTTNTGIDLTQWHTFMVKREANATPITLSIDGIQVLSLSPSPCGLPGCDEGNLNAVFGAVSQVEFAYDFINVVPEPSSVVLLGLGGLIVLRRWRQA